MSTAKFNADAVGLYSVSEHREGDAHHTADARLHTKLLQLGRATQCRLESNMSLLGLTFFLFFLMTCSTRVQKGGKFMSVTATNLPRAVEHLIIRLCSQLGFDSHTIRLSY